MKRSQRFELIKSWKAEYGVITTLYDSVVKMFWGHHPLPKLLFQTQKKLNLNLMLYEWAIIMKVKCIKKIKIIIMAAFDLV